MADRLRGIVDTVESLKEDFVKLEEVLDNIRSVMNLLEDSEKNIETILYTKTMNDGQQKMFFETETPTEAVRRLFKECRGQNLEPKMVIAALNDLIKEGRLRIKPGRNPDRFVHSILHNLVKQEFILRIHTEDSKHPQYVLNEW